MAALVLLFLFTSLTLTAAEKPQAGVVEFQLQGAGKDAFILRDGGARDPISKAQRGKIGLNEVTVAAPGHGTRRLRFWLKAGERNTIDITLSHTRNRVEAEWHSLDKVLPTGKVSSLPAICAFYQEKTGDANLCRRVSFLEDVAFAEPTPYALDDMRALSTAHRLNDFRRLVNRSPNADAKVEAEVEELYRLFPDNGSIFQLNAALALQRGDCPRVHSIFVDAQQVLEDPLPILLYKALCLEVQGQTEAAVNLLQEGVRQGRPPAAYLSYHLARLLLKKDPAAALPLAENCAKSFRFDLSCQELGLMSAKLTQKTFNTQRFNLEEGTFKAFRKLEENLKASQAEPLFFSIIPLVNTYPHSLEFYLFLSWIDAVAPVDGGLDYYARKMQVGAILAIEGLDTAIDTLEKRNLTQLLPPVYRSRLRLSPQDPNLWVRLIRAYSKAGQCPEVLKSIQEGSGILPRYNPQLLQMEGSCKVELGRFREALDTYLKIRTAQPKVWTTYYNLGTVHERLQQRKEAMDNYKLALDYNPPDDMRQSINAKILELETAKAPAKGRK